MDTSQIAQKVSVPTARVVTIALLVELFSILSVGKSPAWLTAAEILNQGIINIGYYAIIFSLVLFPLLLPLMAVAMAANELCYRIISWPVRKIRILDVSMRFSRRSLYVEAELVRSYAESRSDKDLLEKINKKELQSTEPSFMLPSAIFTLLVSIIWFSSKESPNFFMKACSINEPADTCSLYYVVVALAFFQSFCLMAVHGAAFRLAMLFPRADLPAPLTEIRAAPRSAVAEKLKTAMKTWMRGEK
ncbi:hypothetical protein ACFORG_18060 [Lutimaribacter marinistellae]|uniref:ABC transmembrane type-1 domain-containing protein n=1 Tax=Lutimaribacter marinistellae TaxID=1820329 RepID=A0ABV7TKE2_9RHOB